MTPRIEAAAQARAARVRKSTPAEMAAVPEQPASKEDLVEDEQEFDTSVDFDLAKWRDDQKAQEVEATRKGVLFRIDDRREDAEEGALYEIEIPLYSHWPTKAARVLESATVGGVVDALALAARDPELVEVLEELDGNEISAIIEHLAARSGVTPGESKPSGASSKNTRRR